MTMMLTISVVRHEQGPAIAGRVKQDEISLMAQPVQLPEAQCPSFIGQCLKIL